MQDVDTLIDYKGKIKNCIEKANEILNKYSNDIPSYKNDISTLNSLAQEKLNAETPIIMFYGIYNAGKSSIVNEILGDDVAAVQDCPTTDKVTEYKYKNYRIFDTPGVGAPIQHEEVTMSHLKEADIVIFVMSTTGSNEKKENYLRIKDIYDAGKKVIIVLNDKNGDLNSKDQNCIDGLNAIKQKVAANIINVGLSPKDFIIVTVNAQRAKRGRYEKDPVKAEKFKASSNIQELVKIIIQEIKKTTKSEIWLNLLVQLESIYGNCSKQLQKFSNENDMQKYTNEILENIRERKGKIREQIDLLVERKYSMMPEQMQSYIWQNRSNPVGVDDFVNSLIKSTNERISSNILSELKRVYEEINELLSSFKVKIERNVGNLNNQLGNLADGNEATNFAPLLNKINDMLNINQNSGDRINDLNTKNNGSSNPLTAVVGGGVAYELATSATSTALLTSLGMAKFIPYVGPIVMAATVLYSLFGGSKSSRDNLEAEADAQNERERARLEAEKQAHEELIQKCHYAAQNLSDEVKENLIEGINNAFKQLVEPFKNVCSNADDKFKSIVEDLDQLNLVIDELSEIKSLLKLGIS